MADRFRCSRCRSGKDWIADANGALLLFRWLIELFRSVLPPAIPRAKDTVAFSEGG